MKPSAPQRSSHLTDPAPTNPGDIVVTGQRVQAPTFIGAQYPTKSNDPPPVEQSELPGDGPGDGPTLTDEAVQCASADGRKEWNKDARAIRAIESMRLVALQRYGEQDFSSREYGALLCEFADGRVELGPISDGPYVGPPTGGQGSIGIPPGGCLGGMPVGYIHTHPSNNPVPSPADMAFLQHLVDYYDAPASRVSVYIVGTYAEQQYGTPVNRVSVASLADKDAVEQPGYVPKWVNPDALPCPGYPE